MGSVIVHRKIFFVENLNECQGRRLVVQRSISNIKIMFFSTTKVTKVKGQFKGQGHKSRSLSEMVRGKGH